MILHRGVPHVEPVAVDQLDAFDGEIELPRAAQAAPLFGLDDAAGGAGAVGDHHGIADSHFLGDRKIHGLAQFGGFRREVFFQPDADLGSVRDHYLSHGHSGRKQCRKHQVGFHRRSPFFFERFSLSP